MVSLIAGKTLSRGTIHYALLVVNVGGIEIVYLPHPVSSPSPSKENGDIKGSESSSLEERVARVEGIKAANLSLVIYSTAGLPVGIIGTIS